MITFLIRGVKIKCEHLKVKIPHQPLNSAHSKFLLGCFRQIKGKLAEGQTNSNLKSLDHTLSTKMLTISPLN